MGKQKTRLSALIFGGSNWGRRKIAGGTYGVEQQRRLGSEQCRPVREQARQAAREVQKGCVYYLIKPLL